MNRTDIFSAPGVDLAHGGRYLLQVPWQLRYILSQHLRRPPRICPLSRCLHRLTAIERPNRSRNEHAAQSSTSTNSEKKKKKRGVANDGTEVVSLLVLVYPPRLSPEECNVYNIPLELPHYGQKRDAFRTVLGSVGLEHQFDNLPLSTKVVDLLEAVQHSLTRFGWTYSLSPSAASESTSIFSRHERLAIQLLRFVGLGITDNNAKTPRLSQARMPWTRFSLHYLEKDYKADSRTSYRLTMCLKKNYRMRMFCWASTGVPHILLDGSEIEVPATDPRAVMDSISSWLRLATVGDLGWNRKLQYFVDYACVDPMTSFNISSTLLITRTTRTLRLTDCSCWKLWKNIGKLGNMRGKQFVLLEAEELEDSEQDSSDDDPHQARFGAAEIPSQYQLPSTSSSFRLDRVLQHWEPVTHRQKFRRIDDPRPAVSLSSSTHERPIIIGGTDRHATSLPGSASPPPSPLRLPRSSSAPPPRPPLLASTSSTSLIDLAGDGMSTSDGEEDAELARMERLEGWIQRYLGPGGLGDPDFKLFYVRCERQCERSIVQRIRSDIQHQNIDPLLLRTAFPSTLPGGIYLQAQSMLPRNTTLASYLLTIPGLLYHKAPRVVFAAHESAHSISKTPTRTDLVFPIHSVIEDPASAERILREPSQLDEHPPLSWIKCKRGLYKNDVGLVVADDFSETDYGVERLVLFPPRLDLSRIFDNSRDQTSLKRKRGRVRRPDILAWTAAETIARTFCIPTRVDCARHCKAPHSCAHSEPAQKRYICLDQYWQNGLVFKRVKLKHMEHASEILADTRYYFLASNHSAVQRSVLSMPPSSSWEFQTGEAVRFINFDGTWCTPEGQYVFELPAGQTAGIIHYVGPSYCEINIPLRGSNFTVNSLHIMSKVHLEKIFSPGDTVLLLSGARRRLSLHSKNNEPETAAGTEEIIQAGKEGLVISVGPASVEVLLQEHHDQNLILDFHPNTLTKVEQSVSNHGSLRYCPEDYSTATEPFAQHPLYSMNPFTNEVPWKNLPVYPVKYQNKGYRATIVDARLDRGTVSGLSVRIRYEAQGMNNPFAWIDYDCLRRVDNNRFLHDIDGLENTGVRTKWNSYWDLKPDYLPKYSAEELLLLEKGKLLEENPPATDIAYVEPTESRPITPCSSPPRTATDSDSDLAWDPSSPEPSAQHWILDPRIVQGIPQGLELQVATTTKAKRDQKVFFQNSNGITGLYSIIGNRKGGRKPGKADIVKVNPSTILENPRSYSIPSNPGRAKGLYLVSSGDRTGVLCRRLSHMAVKLVRKRTTRVQYEESLDLDLGTFWVEGKDLVSIRETNAMRAAGNSQLEPIRSLYQPVHE
ncbi:hypothetical protein FB446DRAFT_706937 [Lentinula raphanica]|nr:hypothetical protein FB446DRAFT_706937 [Lentinula raphanica]